jgi:hypothetical protein
MLKAIFIKFLKLKKYITKKNMSHTQIVYLKSTKIINFLNSVRYSE